MTQMGLDYMKHKETMRHNMAGEAIDTRNAATNERNAASNERNAATNERNAATNEKDARTRAYTASFKPREVAAQEKQASASASQAKTAADRYQLDKAYKEREVRASEQQAAARMLKAQADKQSADFNNSVDGAGYKLNERKILNEIHKNLPEILRGKEALESARAAEGYSTSWDDTALYIADSVFEFVRDFL